MNMSLTILSIDVALFVVLYFDLFVLFFESKLGIVKY